MGSERTSKGPTIGQSIAFARDRSSDIARFADIVGVLARGARILVRYTDKDGFVGIKAAPLRPAAALGSTMSQLVKDAGAPHRHRGRTLAMSNND
jgi:hypothetical protein